jgi:hypothetical protein
MSDEPKTKYTKANLESYHDLKEKFYLNMPISEEDKQFIKKFEIIRDCLSELYAIIEQQEDRILSCNATIANLPTTRELSSYDDDDDDDDNDYCDHYCNKKFLNILRRKTDCEIIIKRNEVIIKKCEKLIKHIENEKCSSFREYVISMEQKNPGKYDDIVIKLILELSTDYERINLKYFKNTLLGK